LGLQVAETRDAYASAASLFYWIGLGIWLAYAIEWSVRLYRAEPRRAYACSFFGIVDFLAALPLWAISGFDLKVLRAFRLLRLLVTTTKHAGRTKAALRLAKAFRRAGEGAAVLFAGTAIVVGTAGFAMYQLEHEAQPEVFASVFDGMWWAVVTLTTVGYGDVHPITNGGKVLATVAMFVGIGVIGAACGIMADALRETSAPKAE